MRIAIVHSFYSSQQPSGENAVVKTQTQALREAGHEVELFARHTDDAQAKESFYSLRSGGRVALGRGHGFAADVAAYEPDVVHVHNLFPNLGSKWLDGVRAGLVVTVHNHRFECAAATLFRDGAPCNECLTRPVLPAIVHGCYRSRVGSIAPALATHPRRGTSTRMFARADAIVCLNEVARTHVVERVDDASKVTLLPNFVDPPPADFDAVEPIDVLYVGRLSQEKGIVDLARHWPASRKLTIVGEGPDRRQLESVVAGRSDISLVGGQDNDRVRALMRAAQTLIIPSRCPEGFPTVALEAMQLSLPLVLSTDVAVGPMLEAAGAARVYAADDGGASLADALEGVTQAENAYRKAAFELHEAQFSKVAWLSRIEGIYQAAIERSGFGVVR